MRLSFSRILRRLSLCLALLSAFAARPLAAQSTPELPRDGLRLWLRADQGVVTDADGNVQRWEDQSGRNMHATLGNFGKLRVAENAVNGKPALRFAPPETAGGQSPWLQLPNFMEGATAGELFVVIKSSAPAGTSNGAWCLGFDYSKKSGSTTSYYTTEYPNSYGTIRDYFVGGSCSATASQLSTFQVFNVSQDQAGGGILLGFQGETWRSSGTVCSFTSTPQIGRNLKGTPFNGEIAEVIVYDRRLSEVERANVHGLLDKKYAVVPVPGAPEEFTASTPLAGGSVVLRWKNPAIAPLSYQIERRKSSDVDFVQIAEISRRYLNFYSDANVTNGERYDYRVRGVLLPDQSCPISEARDIVPNLRVSDIPVAGLEVWLRSDLSVQTEASGHVTGWLDQSGRNCTFGGTPSPNLALRPFDCNGGPAVVNGYIPMNDILIGANSGEVFYVLNHRFENGNTRYGPSWGYSGYGGYKFDKNVINDDFGTSDPATVLLPRQDFSKYHCYNVSASAGKWVARLNGVEILDRDDNLVAFDGENYGYVGCSNGGIAEIIAYSRVLSAEERSAVYSYLRNRCGVPPAPVPPIRLSGFFKEGNRIELNWAAGDGAFSRYLVERKGPSGGAEVVAQGLVEPRFVDTDVQSGVVYEYWVRVVDAMGEQSDRSASVLVTAKTLSVSGVSGSPCLWLRSDVGVVFTGDGRVAGLCDLGGRGGDVVEADVSYYWRPGYRDSSVMGGPAIEFGRFSDSWPNFTALRMPELGENIDSCELFVVYRQNGNKDGDFDLGGVG